MKSSLFVTLLLAVLSGAAALSHELLWTRRLVDLLGATGEATSRVFGCFFLGLALGGLIAARILPRIKRPWLAVAACELAIAVLALPALSLPWWSEGIWPALGPDLLIGWQGSLTKIVLSAAVVLPPAIPMGMTLPFFVAAVLRQCGTMRWEGTLIYGCNTLGGVLGILISSSLLLELLGVEGSMAAAITVNLVVGLAAWRLSGSDEANIKPVLSRREKKQIKAKKKDAAREGIKITAVDSLVLSFLSGFAILALEILSIRLIGMVVPSSFQATAGVLASVILLLAMAAIATPWLIRSWFTPKSWLLAVFISSSIAASLAPMLLFHRTDKLMNVSYLAAMNGSQIETTTQFLLSICSITIVTVGPALLLGGLVFPIIFAWSDEADESDKAGDNKGKRFGYLLAANGLGGILGAELTQLVVLPNWGIYQGFAVVGLLYALGLVLLLTPWKSPSFFNIATSSIALAIPFLLGGWFQSEIPYLSPRTKVPFEVLAQEFGQDGVLLVVKTPSGDQGILVNNQYLLGSSGSYRSERREVLLPMMLHPKPDNLCCVGVATGISAGAALDYSETCQLTAVEISSLVADAARNHFVDFNRRLFENPQAEVIVEDGRTYIAASQNKFDVIVGDLYRPYGAGEGRLFSVEHFKATRRALRDGGLYCHWLPMYQLTESQFRIIVASFLKAYPEAGLLLANKSTNSPMLALVGWNQSEFDSSMLATNCDQLRKNDKVDDEGLFDVTSVEEMYLGKIDPEHFKQEPLNTLGNVRIEILAGRRKITRDPRGDKQSESRQEPYLQKDTWIDFKQRLEEYLK